MRNIVKIICNPFLNRIAYSFKNEHGEWKYLAGYSVLSRREFTSGSIETNAKNIIRKLDEIYNRNNKGLDIIFEGTQEDFYFIKKNIDDLSGSHNITCSCQVSKIAVLGKPASGKTSLIQSMCNTKDINPIEHDEGSYYSFFDSQKNVEWIEIKGVDYEQDLQPKVLNIIDDLCKHDVFTFLYCISLQSNRMEDFEVDLYKSISNQLPGLSKAICVTNCVQTEKVKRSFVDTISKELPEEKIIPVNAVAFETGVFDSATQKAIVVEQFGLEELSKFIFERR